MPHYVLGGNKRKLALTFNGLQTPDVNTYYAVGTTSNPTTTVTEPSWADIPEMTLAIPGPAFLTVHLNGSFHNDTLNGGVLAAIEVGGAVKENTTVASQSYTAGGNVWCLATSWAGTIGSGTVTVKGKWCRASDGVGTAKAITTRRTLSAIHYPVGQVYTAGDYWGAYRMYDSGFEEQLYFYTPIPIDILPSTSITLKAGFVAKNTGTLKLKAGYKFKASGETDKEWDNYPVATENVSVTADQLKIFTKNLGSGWAEGDLLSIVLDRVSGDAGDVAGDVYCRGAWIEYESYY